MGDGWVHIGGLPTWATDADLYEVLGQYGAIKKAYVVPGAGYGFVGFQHRSVATALLQPPPHHPPVLGDHAVVISHASRGQNQV